MQNAINIERTLLLNEIRKYTPTNLIQLAAKLEVSLDGVRQKDILSIIMSNVLKQNKEIRVEGVLDIVNENYGFLRYQSDSYVNSNEDIFVNNSLIKNFNLRMGDTILATIKAQNNSEKHYTIKDIVEINGLDPDKSKVRNTFENMVALYPKRKINLESDQEQIGAISLRIMDLMVPTGFGQRSLIVAPPKTGKTTLMKSIAHAIINNHKDAHVIVLLIGERPEEVTDMKRSVIGAEVVSSTFDEPASQHVHVAELALAKAKRLAEIGKDVVILMDSLTRYTRSNNAAIPSSGKVLTGGIDANALQQPKQFFGAARDLEDGGSITIIATTLVETGSKADEVIHEEFKGTGNSEIVLDRRIAEYRIFPAMDITKSGTRKEELLLTQRQCATINLLKRALSSKNNIDAIKFMLSKMHTTSSNVQFLESLNRQEFDNDKNYY